MISAARGQTAEVHADWSGALVFVCSFSVVAHAFMIAIERVAYAASPVKYQSSACVYAAVASSISSPQPLFGSEYAPHSTVARGCALYVVEAAPLRLVLSNAAFHGATPAAIFALTRSSCSPVTSTPG